MGEGGAVGRIGSGPEAVGAGGTAGGWGVDLGAAPADTAKETSVFRKQRWCTETNKEEGDWTQLGTVGRNSAHREPGWDPWGGHSILIFLRNRTED